MRARAHSSRMRAASSCPADAHGLAVLKGFACEQPAGSSFATSIAIPAVRLCVWPSETDEFISNGILQNGTWLLWHDEAVRRHVVCELAKATRRESLSDRTPWLLDVGANIGTFTLPLLAAGFNVMAFEAFAPNFALLQASVEVLSANRAQFPLQGRAILVNKALTAPRAPKTLCMTRGGADTNQGHTRIDASAACDERVATSTLDEEVRAHLPSARVEGLKMDIEGHEHLALQGAARLLGGSHHRPSRIFVEAVENRDQVHRLLSNHSFRCRLFTVRHGNASLRPPCDFACAPR